MVFKCIIRFFSRAESSYPDLTDLLDQFDRVDHNKVKATIQNAQIRVRLQEQAMTRYKARGIEPAKCNHPVIFETYGSSGYQCLYCDRSGMCSYDPREH